MAAEISKPDFSYQWSSGGSIVAPSNVKIQTGWTAEVPPFQWENWSQNRQDNAILHLFQKGISEWDAASNYYFTASGVRSYVQGSDGNIYLAVADSLNQNPVTDTTNVYWKVAFSAATGRIDFTANGSFTVPVGVTTIYVTAAAGGGGGGGGSDNSTGQSSLVGGGGGGGGGAGESIYDKSFSVTPGQVIAITVGAAGTAGTAGTAAAGGAGGAGGNTVIGSLVTLTGGGGGGGGLRPVANSLPNGGAGAAGGTGFPIGSNGTDGNYAGNGGVGASTILGGGGGAGRAATAVGLPGRAGFGFGSGGGGGGAGYGSASAVNGGAGGAGTPGFVRIRW